MQNKVPIKINLSGLCENVWFPWQPLMPFLNGGGGGGAFKITHISAATNPRLLNMVSN